MQNPEFPNTEGKTWWQRHKKIVLITGGVAVMAVGSILLYKNWASVTELAMNTLRKKHNLVLQPHEINFNYPAPKAEPDTHCPTLALINGGKAFPVNGHIRNLPASWTPSPEQRAFAEAMGITLGDHQTYVRDYTKNCA